MQAQNITGRVFRDYKVNGTLDANDVNLGISPDGQYCPPITDVDIITTCAVTGDPFATGNNSVNDGILIRTDYLAINM